MRPSAAQLLTSAGTSSYLVFHPVQIGYLTGFCPSYGFVLVTKSGYSLFLDDRYYEAASGNGVKGVRVLPIVKLESAMKRVKQCGFEGTIITVEQLRTWKKKFPGVKFVSKPHVIEEFRRQKSPEEIRSLKRADAITKKMLTNAEAALKPGITERALAWKLQQWAVEFGAEGVSFDPIVAFGPHTSRPHHQATNRKLKKRDIVQIDCGARSKGYCGDCSRVFFVGTPTNEQKRVYDAVAHAKKTAERLVRAGVSAQKIDEAARAVLRSYDLENHFTHALGHGVGLDIHEGVTVSIKSKDTLRKNEVITIEPGVYLPGKFGIRLEDIVVVSS